MITDRPGSVRQARILDVDVLRGLALLGILVVNLPFAASGYYHWAVPDPAFTSPLDHGVRWLILAFFTMKFDLLFSFLFGYSFVLQMEAASRAGSAFEPRMRRRLIGLFALGVVNAVFLVTGDILMTYALIGTILLVMRGVRDRTAVIVAGAMYGLVLVVGLGSTWLFADGSSVVDQAEALARGREATAHLAGGFRSVVGEHLAALPLYSTSQLAMRSLAIFAMFLLGLISGRRRLLSGLAGQERALRAAQMIGFPVGIAGGVFYASAGGNASPAGVLVCVMTAPLMVAAYAATVVRMLHRSWGRSIGSVLAPAGQMALSNYLGQSVATLFIFTGIGFGLVGQVSPLEMVLITVVVFVVQVAISNWWLSWFSYGPAEWLLRWITNGARSAWRKQPGAVPERAPAVPCRAGDDVR